MRTLIRITISAVLLFGLTAEARVYLPRIGRFLSSDRAGMVDGPNLYQYVRSSPAMFTDPTGNKFVNPPPQVREVLDRLRQNEDIGSEILGWETSTRVEISFIDTPASEYMAQRGGAETTLILGPRGGVDKYTVTYNLALARGFISAYFGLGESLGDLIAHELGHVKAYTEGIGPGAGSNDLALYFENSERLVEGSGFRPIHDPVLPSLPIYGPTPSCPLGPLGQVQ